MNYTIKNTNLSATFTDLGGELISLKKGDVEYIWYGDKQYWGGQSPLLFPYCCRLFGGHYTYHGQNYEGANHGFIRRSLLAADVHGDSITFSLRANEETRKLYPFDFEYAIKYTLEGDSLICETTVKNLGDETLHYCNGMHPGFNVPLGTGTKFEDWYMEFGGVAQPKQILFSEGQFCVGEKDFSDQLVGGTKLPLRHSLFDDDAIFLTGAADSVTLRCDASERSVTVSYPNTPVIGFWHMPFTDSPYVCIEPLCGLPSFEGKVDDIETKLYAKHLGLGESHTDTVKITVN